MNLNQVEFVEVLLTPSWIKMFREVLFIKHGVKVFPIGHTRKYRQATCVDIYNIHGRGHNSVFSGTGGDTSHHLLISTSFEEFLLRHLDNLRNNRLQVHNGIISAFRRFPQEIGGSISVTSGIKVEAQAILNHMFCRLDKETFQLASPKYFFIYQIKLSVIQPTTSIQIGGGLANQSPRLNS